MTRHYYIWGYGRARPQYVGCRAKSNLPVQEENKPMAAKKKAKKKR
jgi:hypothetical protein